MKNLNKILREQRLKEEKLYGRRVSKVWGGKKMTKKQLKQKDKDDFIGRK